MNNLIQINYDAEQPTVSARDLHEGLEIKTRFNDWFPRMTEYGFEVGKDFYSKMSESIGGRPSTDYQISVDMAKQICMIQRSDKGRLYRQYFLDLENDFLIKGGSSKNMPTQKAMEMGLFEIKEGSYINGSGANITTKTTKVTGKGQQYFINKFLVG